MNRKLNFTSDGYLTPVDGIESNLKTFRKNFVEHFSSLKTRQYLFDNYLEYLTKADAQLDISKKGFIKLKINNL